jgi:hypothetical protein
MSSKNKSHYRGKRHTYARRNVQIGREKKRERKFRRTIKQLEMLAKCPITLSEKFIAAMEAMEQAVQRVVSASMMDVYFAEQDKEELRIIQDEDGNIVGTLEKINESL